MKPPLCRANFRINQTTRRPPLTTHILETSRPNARCRDSTEYLLRISRTPASEGNSTRNKKPHRLQEFALVGVGRRNSPIVISGGKPAHIMRPANYTDVEKDVPKVFIVSNLKTIFSDTGLFWPFYRGGEKGWMFSCLRNNYGIVILAHGAAREHHRQSQKHPHRSELKTC